MPEEQQLRASLAKLQAAIVELAIPEPIPSSIDKRKGLWRRYNTAWQTAARQIQDVFVAVLLGESKPAKASLLRLCRAYHSALRDLQDRSKELETPSQAYGWYGATDLEDLCSQYALELRTCCDQADCYAVALQLLLGVSPNRAADLDKLKKWAQLPLTKIGIWAKVSYLRVVYSSEDLSIKPIDEAYYLLGGLFEPRSCELMLSRFAEMPCLLQLALPEMMHLVRSLASMRENTSYLRGFFIKFVGQLWEQFQAVVWYVLEKGDAQDKDALRVALSEKGVFFRFLGPDLSAALLSQEYYNRDSAVAEHRVFRNAGYSMRQLTNARNLMILGCDASRELEVFSARVCPASVPRSVLDTV